MIRKNLLLTLLMALFVPLAALAQNAPTNLSVVLRPDDGTVAYLKWDPAGSETQWTLDYWTNPDWVYYSTKQVDNMPQQRLTGLTPNTTYYVRVKARNGSTYSETFSFTTKDFHQIGDVDNGLSTNEMPCNTDTKGRFSVQRYQQYGIPEGTINKIYFYVRGDNEYVASRNFSVYMNRGETWLGGDWWEGWEGSPTVKLGHKVYQGTKVFRPGWNEITLDKPYRFSRNYSANPSNDYGLFVWFMDETQGASAAGALNFACDINSNSEGLYSTEDVYSYIDLNNNDYYINTKDGHYYLKKHQWSPGDDGIVLTLSGRTNCIRLGYESVDDVAAEVCCLSTDVTGEGSARLIWDGENAEHYVLQYGTSSDFASNQTTTKYLYYNSFYLSGLSPTQTYHWRVKAVGAFNETDWRVGTSFEPTKQVAIGSGTATNFYLPFNSNYKYYLSQQIYTASEMTKAGIVESVTFECSTLSNPETRNLDIYMVHTDKMQFNSESDWVPVTPDDLVFSGPVTFQNGLNPISFNSGFEYDGQRNVVLVVDDNTGGYGTTPNFAVFTTPNLNQSITYGNSINNVDVQNTSGISQHSVDLYSTKNRVTFNINTPSGMNKPTGLAATLDPDTPTEATLRWTENGTATRWNVRYGTDPSFADCQTMEVSDTPQAQLTGLTPETTYYAQVRSLQNSVSAWSAPIAFVPTDKIVVGAGEAISSVLPIWGIITAISQQIYTADELLNEPRLIESISFYCENITFTRRSVGIHLMHTDKEVFDNTDDMMSIDNGVTVFNGEVTFVAGEWTTINFTTPFAYDGTSNVALTVGDYSGSQQIGGFPNFKAFETGRNQAIVSYQDSGPMYTQLDTEKNQVRWGCSAVCEAIYHHPEQVAYFPGNSADVWWFEMGEATEWTVQHGPNANFTEGSYTEQNVTGEPYLELKNLTPNSVGEYYVRVRSVCGEGFHSLWSDVITLRPEASNEICDGGGNSTAVLPTSPNYYNYYLSQQIYTRQELRNMPCAIGSVEFNWQNTMFPVRNLDIYMVHTNKTQFDSKSDWVQVTADDLVFSGETDFGHSTITFNKRFMYDGTSNVVLVVNDKTGNMDTNWSELYFVFETENNQALYAGNNYANIDPLGQLFAAEGIVNMKNCVTFGWEECPILKPTMHDPTLTPNNPTVATLNWTENGTATEWVLQYGASDEFGYNFEELLGEITVTGTPTFNLTGLSPWIYYQARVKAVYREGDAEYHSDWSQTAMFMTDLSLDIDGLWIEDITDNSWVSFTINQNFVLPEYQSMEFDYSIGTVSGGTVTSWHDMGSDTYRPGRLSNFSTFLPVGEYTFRVRFRVLEGNNTVATGQWLELGETFSIVAANPVNNYPFTLDFEGPVPPAGFNLSGTIEDVNRFEFGTEATTGIAPHSEGSSYLCFHHDGNESHEASVVLPMFYSASPTQMALSFWLYNSAEGSGSTLSDVAAYVSSDGENWTIISGSGVYGAECRGAWHRYVCSFNLTGEAPITPHAYVRLRFVCVEDAPEQYFCLDDISVKPIADYKPYISQATSTAYSVTLSVIDNAYEAGSGSEQYEVEYRAVGTDSWTTMAFMMEAPYENYVQLTVDGLDPNTYYEFRAFSKIPTGKSNIILWTDESNTVTKWTDNGPFIVSPGHPYEFGFETYASGWTVPEGWDTYYDGGYESVHCAAHIGNNRESLLSPEIGFHESCDNVIIRFRAKGVIPNSSYSPICFVYSSDDDFTSPVNIGTLSVTSLSADTWKECVFSLCRFMSSGSVKIAFDPGLLTEYSIDNIEIVANAYDKVIGDKLCLWQANKFYPQGLPEYSDNVLVCSSVQMNLDLGKANNIEFGTNGSLMVRANKTLSLNSAHSKITANKANALQVSGTVITGVLVPQAEGSVKVNDGGVIHAVEIAGEDYTASPNLVINDGGQVHCSNPFYGTYYKNITGYGAENVNQSTGWNLIAPLESGGAVSMGLVPKNGEEYVIEQMDLYGFDQSAELEWINKKKDYYNYGNDVRYLIVNPKEGYLYARQDDGTLNFRAIGGYNVFRATTQDVEYDELVYDAEAAFAGWNLIGNPYTANAYVKDAEGNAMAYYRMNDTGDRIELAVAGTPIKPCEGVFVQVTDNGSNDIDPVWFTTTAPNSGRGAIDFTLSKQSSTRNGASASATPIDRARISFNEGKGMGHLDLMADANRLYIPQSGKDMAVVCSEPAGEMPLNFEAAENGTYTLGISLNDTELVYCHLIDNLTGADVDLLATSTGSVAEYTFEAKTTDYRSRFKVVFVAKSAFEGDNANNFAFHNGSAWVVNASADATVQVIDMMGRVVLSTDVARNVSTKGMAPGVYVMRLIDGKDVKTQKIVVD